jgi:hypothetical protein
MWATCWREREIAVRQNPEQQNSVAGGFGEMLHRAGRLEGIT